MKVEYEKIEYEHLLITNEEENKKLEGEEWMYDNDINSGLY